MKKYYPVDFDEKGNAVLGNAKSNPTSNSFIPTTWTPGGGSEDEGNGIKSISISPNITTTPALDTLFPLYWDDLPEGEIEEGVEYRTYEATLHTGHALTEGTQYTISVTPTSDWRATNVETEGDIGETITYTVSVHSGALFVDASVDDSVPEKAINASIIITE